MDTLEGREADGPEAAQRDKPGDFMVLELATWDRIWRIDTARDFDHAAIYLLLLQGTGKDHHISKWSARACARHLGIQWPRAKKIIERLAAEGLFEIGGSVRSPRYFFPEPADGAQLVFLPNELVRAATPGNSLLVTLRKARDPFLLRLLVTIYGLVQPDLTRCLPITAFNDDFDTAFIDGLDYGERSVAGVVSETDVWSLETIDHQRGVYGDWTRPYRGPSTETDPEGLDLFWFRLDKLFQFGALVTEAWVFDRLDLEADPLHPIDLGEVHEHYIDDRDARALDGPAGDLVEVLATREDWQGGSWFVPDMYGEGVPRLRGVLRPRLLAQTAPMFDANEHRRNAVSTWVKIYDSLADVARFERGSVAIK